MNLGVAACGILCLVFLVFALLFTVLGEKAAMLISGFNTMPKEQRELYDKAKMSREHRNAFLIWAAIQGAGAILSYCFMQYSAIGAFVIWLIVFFKDVHLEEEKAFGRYLLSENEHNI